MRAGPPRGMRQSMRPRRRMKATAVSCEVSSTRATASAGRPAFSTARRRMPTMAWFEARAEAEPRRKAAFPALRQSPAASLVTLGRFS